MTGSKLLLCGAIALALVGVVIVGFTLNFFSTLILFNFIEFCFIKIV